MNDTELGDLIRTRITRQLYQHAPAAIFANILNVLVVFLLFRSVIDIRVNLAWATGCIAFLLVRLAFTRSVLGKGIEPGNHRRRLREFGLTVCVSGILFGSSGILYLAPDRPAHNAFIFFLMGGVFAGALGAFAIERRVFAAYSIPLILPVTVHSLVLGGEINTAMAGLGIVFSAMMALLVRRMNATMVSAFRLEIQNGQLAADTQRLNEELLEANERLRELSFHDALTSATNRRFLTDILQCEVDRAMFARRARRERGEPAPDPDTRVYGLFMIDIDHFKRVNDGWGHASGDLVLRRFAEVLRSLVRKEDVVTRWGGEEFVVVLKQAAPEYLPRFAARVVAEVAATEFPTGGTGPVRLTCSVGFAEFPFFPDDPEGGSLEATLGIADLALYRAKAEGRDRAVRAENRMAPSGADRPGRDCLGNLAEALDRGWIRLTRV